MTESTPSLHVRNPFGKSHVYKIRLAPSAEAGAKVKAWRELRGEVWSASEACGKEHGESGENV